MAYEKQSAEQKRERYLRLAKRARDDALKSSSGLQATLLQVAESWDLLARSVSELEQLKPASQLTIYRRTRDWLRQNTGHCCCDECLAPRIGGPRANVSVATRRIGTEHGYCKYAARCDYCGDARLVTRASPDAL